MRRSPWVADHAVLHRVAPSGHAAVGSGVDFCSMWGAPGTPTFRTGRTPCQNGGTRLEAFIPHAFSEARSKPGPYLTDRQTESAAVDCDLCVRVGTVTAVNTSTAARSTGLRHRSHQSSPSPGRLVQFRRGRDDRHDVVREQGSSETVNGRASLVNGSRAVGQSLDSAGGFDRVTTRLRREHLAGLDVHGVRHDAAGMHVQTDTRTLGKQTGASHVCRKGQTGRPCPATHESLRGEDPTHQTLTPKRGHPYR